MLGAQFCSEILFAINELQNFDKIGMEIKIIEVNNLRKEAEELKKNGFRLVLVSGVDWISKNNTFEVLYHFGKFNAPEMQLIKVSLPADNPHVPTISDLFGLADWHERETYDLFGIIFDGHPNLKRIFLPDDFKGHPLRKDFMAYKRVLPG